MRLLVLIPLCVAIVFVACDRRSTPQRYRVALITTGSVGDGGWNQTAFQGLKKVQAELNADISNLETRSPAEFEEAFRDYAARGFKLVFGHGFEYQEAALKVAPQFPETWFLITSGQQAQNNVVPLIFRFGEATYLAGMVAATVSKSGKLGAIGGQAFPPVKDGFNAFLQGARSINSNAMLTESYVGNWEDAAAAKEAALALIRQGVDVIIQNADAAGMGVFQAIRETPGVYAVGTNANQNGIVPDRVLGSAINDVAAAMVLVAHQAKSNTLQPGPLHLGMKEGVVRFETNDKLRDLWKGAANQIEAAEQSLKAGRWPSPKQTQP